MFPLLYSLKSVIHPYSLSIDGDGYEILVLSLPNRHGCPSSKISCPLSMKRICISRQTSLALCREARRPHALLPPATASTSNTGHPRRYSSSLSQRLDAKHLSFPGAVKSEFNNTMRFEQPASYPALPTYRAIDQHGTVVDPSFKPDLSDEAVIELYRDMLSVSIMDVIMFDAQRQGRLSFYMVSAGEEAVSVATASALEREDVIFCQYREQGVFKQRGFTPADFMNQLFANNKDPGRGRNMPVHYGSKELNIVRCLVKVDRTDVAR